MSEKLQDKLIVCGCGKEFTFRVKDQEFFKKMVDEGKFKGPYTEPKRCMDFRTKKRQDKEAKERQNASPFMPVLAQFKKSGKRGPKELDEAIDEVTRPGRAFQMDEDTLRHEREEPADFSGSSNEDR